MLLTLFTTLRISSVHCAKAAVRSSSDVLAFDEPASLLSTATSVRQMSQPSPGLNWVFRCVPLAVSYAGVSRIRGISCVRVSFKMFENVCRPRWPLLVYDQCLCGTSTVQPDGLQSDVLMAVFAACEVTFGVIEVHAFEVFQTDVPFELFHCPSMST